MGIEPTLAGSRPTVPPQHFSPKILVGAAGNAPASPAYQASVLLLNYAPWRCPSGFSPEFAIHVSGRSRTARAGTMNFGGEDGDRTRDLLVGNESCYRYTTSPKILVGREGIEPSSTCFKGRAPIPAQSAGQWWVRRDSDPQVPKDGCFTGS